MKKLAPFGSMKILPRADLLASKYLEFLQELDLIEQGNEAIINPLPYTLSTILPDYILECFGATSCTPIVTIEGIKSRSLDLKVTKLIVERCNVYEHQSAEITFLILEYPIVKIYVFNDIERLYILREEGGYLYIDSIPLSNDIKRVYGILIRDRAKRTMGFIFSNPTVLYSMNKKVLEIEFATRPAYVFVSSRYTLSMLLRFATTSLSVYHVKGLNVVFQPLIELRDFLTYAIPESAEGRCIEYKIVNPYPSAVNSIVKVYRKLKHIEIDNVTEYDYKRTIFRIGLAPQSYSIVKLCF